MTLILLVATLGVLIFLGVACRQARLDLEEQLCECLQSPVAAAVGFGADPLDGRAAPPVLTRIEGGRPAGCGGGHPNRGRHLRVVKAG